MPKKIEDIVPKKKSIRDIPIPIRRINGGPAKSESKYSPDPVSVQRPVEPTVLPRLRTDLGNGWEPPKKKKFSRRMKWFSGLVILALCGLVFAALRGDTTLTYKPKTVSASFADEEYSAYETPESDQLGYSVIKISGDQSISLPADGEETVSIKASGQVVIYNTQKTSQQLVKTTRLETSDGKIYRITDNVTIPAEGNIEVTAEADKPGDTYNIALSDFTIPGFKGTSKFESVYARSKTAMTGGFDGTRKKVSDDALATNLPKLESDLKAQLLSTAQGQIPLDYVLFPELSTITYESLPREGGTDGNVKVSEHGNLSAVIVKRTDLANYLASKKLDPNQNLGQVEIPDYSSLNVAFADAGVNLLSDTSVTLKFSGSVVFRAVVDESALRNDLAGKSKNDLQSILQGYPAIESATASIKPVWSSTFPQDGAKIKLVRNTNGS